MGTTLHALVVSVLYSVKEIERIHLKFCKSLLNVKNTTCTMYVYGEL